MTRSSPSSRHAWSTLLCLAAISAHLAGCASDQAGADTKATPDAEATPGPTFTKQEQAVYSAILASTFGAPSYVLRTQFAVVGGAPEEAAESFQYLAKDLGALSGDTFVYCWQANQQQQAIPADLNIGAPYTVIDETKLRELLASDPGRWSGFFARFPDAPGVLDIGHVGFDVAGKQALAFLSWQAGGLAMWCRYFLLELDGDTWRVVDDVITLEA
jgi:hypothetical protein